MKLAVASHVLAPLHSFGARTDLAYLKCPSWRIYIVVPMNVHELQIEHGQLSSTV